MREKNFETENKEKNEFFNNDNFFFNTQKLNPQVEEALNKITNMYSQMANKFGNMQTESLNLFNHEIINQTVNETCKVAFDKFVQEPDLWSKKQKIYLKNMEDLFSNTINKIRGAEVEPIIAPLSNDKRFKAPEWENVPFFDYLKQSYLLQTSYLDEIIESLDEIHPKTKEKIKFYTKNLMDAVSPTNFPMTNPEVWKEINNTKGQNIINGYKKLLEDNAKSNFLSLPMFTDLNAFKVGENLATTEGKVIFENDLFQLLYYKPTKSKSYETPMLIIPPWINKYYIFDLQQENSFIKWLLDKGISAFVLSWINPDESYGEYKLEDYVINGALKAVEEVLKATKKDEINLMAYCTGGVAATLLSAYLATQKKDYIKSLTLLASPVDFEKMGDLKVFVCEQQLEHMEKHITKLGYLPGDVMVKVFSILRSNELIWSNYVNTYLLNKDPFPLDFLYWNCDTTHIPARMHIEYLKNIFHENALMHPGSFKIKGAEVDLKKIKIPKFVFATKSDHIVPWESAFAIKKFCNKTTKFVLGASGHVAGIINPPKKNKYCYWHYKTKKEELKINNSCEWFNHSTKIEGSWWNEWFAWIKKFSGEKVENKIWELTDCIEQAPGRYATSSKPSV